MNRQLISTGELDSSFPYTPGTLYVGRSLGRYPWLTREGPNGRRGRRLWVDAIHFNAWAAERGLKFRLHSASAEASRAEVQH